MTEVNTQDISAAEPDDQDLAELQLQQELRSMFNVDTQEYLQTYISLVQRLQAPSWTADIQELYRCIHTIKGGAVTVGADAVLYISTVLEDLLADLRYLQVAPELADGKLSQMLLEAGELLTAGLQVDRVGQAAQSAVQPSVDRIKALREIIQSRYFTEWSENQQLFQEFAENGFDLVVLELTMALEQLLPEQTVPSTTLETTQQTLQQLAQIGQDLEFDAPWQQLLNLSQAFLQHLEAGFWLANWPGYLQLLKETARQGGKVSPPAEPLFEFDYSAPSPQIAAASASPEALDADLDAFADLDLEALANLDLGLVDATLEGSAPAGAGMDAPEPAMPLSAFMEMGDEWAGEAIDVEPNPDLADDLAGLDLDALLDLDLSLAEIDSIPAESPGWEESAVRAELEAEFDPILGPDAFIVEEVLPVVESDAASINFSPSAAADTPTVAATANVQIPVPLERLDRSAQSLVETLLSTRSVQGFYSTLESQLIQMVRLAEDNAKYITRLRQIQDDYALLDNLQGPTNSSQGPVIERYRQGYTIINRLLENSLRLQELGAEVSTSHHQTAESLELLDRNILNLQQTVEDSRLVAFKTLGFRARGILRDLSNRYGKPAQLIVNGEQLELDAGTVQALEPALLHLIRNAFDHGLETPAERIAARKPEQGTITLSLRRQGNTYSLDLQDDGRGIDAQRIQQIAQGKGLPLNQTDTPAQLLDVLCQPGFSSRDQVSDISGRGVGMDVVANQVSSLGGRLSLETVLHQGTRFHLQIPVPRLLVRCVLVQAGEKIMAIPADEVITTNLLDNLSATPVVDQNLNYGWQIAADGQSLPGLNLAEYWSQEERSLSETAVCLRVRAATTADAQDVWLVADDLLEQTDLLINPIPRPLVLPAGLMGVSQLANGKLVPVLEPTTLAEWILSHPSQSAEAVKPTPSQTESGQKPVSKPGKSLTSTILVVDDAALVRRRIEASLTSYGYVVHTCRDGLEAWNWLQTNPSPSLMISDIEMPGMDGFTLINRCRQAEMTMPVMVISSRLSEEWGNEARRLGANDYLTKGFTTAELIQKVNILITAGVS